MTSSLVSLSHLQSSSSIQPTTSSLLSSELVVGCIDKKAVVLYRAKVGLKGRPVKCPLQKNMLHEPYSKIDA